MVTGQEIEFLNDGPYVFYSKDSIIVKNIVRKNSRSIVEQQSYSLIDKHNALLSINFSKNKKWNFSTKLKPVLAVEPSFWKQPVKLIVFSDIEGEFEAFRNLLIYNKVIDQNYNWTFGNGHLVICGDLFDRGLHVTEQLWLLYKLEQDAQAQGGYVHVLLGNHDIINLSGDVRYVQPVYFQNAITMQTTYLKLYDQNTELGRWLRTKNIIEKVGDFLFLHAGISPQVNQLQLSIDSINTLSRPFYDKGTHTDLDNQPLISTFFEENSPFWYRGYFTNPMATQNQIDSTLKLFDVKKIIVGHTILHSNIAAYHQDKVIGIAVNQHDLKHEGILFENGVWSIVDYSGKSKKMKSF